jgi:antitoxin VapB
VAYLFNGAATVKTAKIFQHGNSQAVRLPKEFRFEEDEVVIKHHAGGVLLLPKRYSVDDLLEILQQFEGPIERGENAPAQKRKF